MTSQEIPSRIPMKTPFAMYADTDLIDDIQSNKINYIDGFPTSYETPISQGGRFVSRTDVNAIMKMATQDQFYYKCGGINTFDAEFAKKVGGYPKGAVLMYNDGVNIQYVVSLIDNNMVDFTDGYAIDGQSWKFLNTAPAIDKALVFETSTQWATGSANVASGGTANADVVQPTFLGNFRVPKNGQIVADVGITVQTGIHEESYMAGTGLFLYKLTSATSLIPPIKTVADLDQLQCVYNRDGAFFIDTASVKHAPINVVSVPAREGDYYAVIGVTSGSAITGDWGPVYAGTTGTEETPAKSFEYKYSNIKDIVGISGTVRIYVQ